MAVDFAAFHRAALYHHAVRRLVGVDTQPSEPLGHDRDAVALLHAQLLGAAQHRLPGGRGGGNKQDRELIDRQRHLVIGNHDAVQRTAAHADIGDRFAARFAGVRGFNIRAHALQYVHNPRACGIDAHVLQQQVGTGGDGTADEKKGGR